MSALATLSDRELTPRRGPGSDVSLIDLLDRLLQGGVVVMGDVILAAADIDLVRLDLRLLISAVDKAASR